MNVVMMCIIIGTLVLFNAINTLTFHNGFSIIKIFNYSWIFMICVYLFNPLGYYSLSSSVLAYVILFVFSVNISQILFRRKIRTDELFNEDELQNDYNCSDKKVKLLAVLSVICWFFSRNRLANSIGIITSQGMAILRTYTYYGDVYSTIEKLAYQYFVQPLFIITIIVAVETLVFFQMKKNKYILIVAIIDALVYSLLFGGRSLLLLVLLYLAFVLLIRNSGSITQIIKKQKKIVLVFFVLMVFIGSYSMMRVTRDWGILSEFIVYITGGLGMFSKLISEHALPVGALHGWGFIGCIHDFFGLALKFIGVNIELVSQIYSRYVTDFLFIGNGIKTNFTVTAMGSFYLDFGVLGIVVGGFVYGLLFAIVENKYALKKSVYTLSLYIYVSNIAFESIQNYTLKSVVFLFVMIYMLLILKEKRHCIMIGNKRLL